MSTIRTPLFASERFEALSIVDKLRYLVSLAIMAPSSHNTQPWLFVINAENSTIELRANMRRKLASSDSENRQLYLSLGAALGNLIMATRAFGLIYTLRLPVELERAIAVFSFSSLKPITFDQSMLEAIINRQNNRFPFTQQHILPSFFEEIKEICADKVSATVITDQAIKTKLQVLVEDAVEESFTDKNFTSELSLWIKPSLKKYRDGMPGYNIDVPWLLSFVMPWAIKHLPVAKAQRKMNAEMLANADAYVILSTTQDRPIDILTTGMIMEQVAITAEKRGIKMGIMASPVAIGNYHKRLQDMLHLTGRPQIFFRLGYTEKNPRPSPRLDLEQVIINE